jgi:hypothetical protein
LLGYLDDSGTIFAVYRHKDTCKAGFLNFYNIFALSEDPREFGELVY